MGSFIYTNSDIVGHVQSFRTVFMPVKDHTTLEREQQFEISVLLSSFT